MVRVCTPTGTLAATAKGHCQSAHPAEPRVQFPPEVTEDLPSPQVSAVGNIAFNERDQAFVQARATGYIERLRNARNAGPA